MNDPSPGADEFAVNLENPWPGPESFSEAQAEFFRGRELETDELLDLVHESPLTILHGKSGLGKTSLLQAGLFPLLRREGFLPVYVRLRHRDATTEYAEEVRQALIAAAEAAQLTFDHPSGSETLWENFEPARTRFISPHGRPLTPVLVFDQFEELFTLGREGEQNPGRYQRFAAELANLVENQMPAAVVARERARRLAEITSASPSDESAAAAPSSERRNCRVILSLRADFLDVLEHELARSIPSLARNRFCLMNMNGQQAHDAVIEAGGRLIEEGVATRIIRTVASRADRGADAELPLEKLVVEPALLSIFCRELNESRKRDHLAKINAALVEGSREEILQGFYDRAFEKLPPASRGRVRLFVEDSLVTADGFRDNIALSRATKEHNVGEEDIACLVKARLLRVEDAGDGRPKRVELTHDVLAGIAYRSLLRRRLAERELKEREEAEQRERAAKQELLRAEEDARQADDRARDAEARRAEADRLRVAAEKAHRRALLWAIAAGLVAALAIWAFIDAHNQKLIALDKQRETARAKSADEDLIESVEDNIGAGLVQHISQQSSLTSSDQLKMMEQVNEKILQHYSASRPDPDDLKALQNNATALEEHGAVLMAERHLPAAAKEYVSAVNIREQLVASDLENKIQRSRELAVSEDALGDIFTALGQLPDASAAYNKAWNIRTAFVGKDKGAADDAQWQCDLAISEDKIGSIFVTQNDYETARQHFNKALDIRTLLAAQKQGDLKLKLNLQYFSGEKPVNVAMNYFIAVSHRNLGNVLAAWGIIGANPENISGTATNETSQPQSADSATSEYSQALTRFKDLVAADDPEHKNGQWIYDLAGMYGSIGNLYENEGDLKDAREQYYDVAQTYRERLLALDSTNAGWKDKFAIGDDHIGNVLKEEGVFPENPTAPETRRGALFFYNDALKIREELAGNDQDRTDTTTEENLAVSYTNLGSVKEIQGDLDGGLTYYAKALAIIEDQTFAPYRSASNTRNLPALDSNNVSSFVETLAVNGRRPRSREDSPTLWNPFAGALDNVGNILTAQGNLSGALASYKIALEVRQDLAAQEEAAPKAKTGNHTDTALQSALAVSFDNVGDTLRDQGHIPEAVVNYETARGKLQDLLKIDRKNTEWQNELALNWDSFGSVLVIQGDFDSALKAYRECIQIEGGLVAQEDKNPLWKNENALNLDHAGDIYAREAELKADNDANKAELQKNAGDLYDQALDLRQKLSDQFGPQLQASAQLKDNLAVTYYYEGEKFAAQSMLSDALQKEALQKYDEASKIVETLLTQQPHGNIQWAKDLSKIYDHTGDVYEGQGKSGLAQARTYHENCIKIEEDLIKKEPNNAEFLSNLAKSYSDLGDILGEMNDSGNMKEYQDALRIKKPLSLQYPNNIQWRHDVAYLEGKLAPKEN